MIEGVVLILFSFFGDVNAKEPYSPMNKLTGRKGLCNGDAVPLSKLLLSKMPASTRRLITHFIFNALWADSSGLGAALQGRKNGNRV